MVKTYSDPSYVGYFRGQDPDPQDLSLCIAYMLKSQQHSNCLHYENKLLCPVQ